MFRRYLELPRSVFLLCLGALVNRAGAMVLPFLVLYLTESRGFGPAAAARIMGAFGVGTMFAALIGGTLADRLGRKPVMVGSLVGSAMAISLIPHVGGEPAAFAAVLLLALTTDAYRPAASAMLSDATTPELRPRAYALFYAAINLGFTVGATLGGWLVVATSYDVLFTIEAASALVFAVFISVVLPETRPEPSASAEAVASAAVDAGAAVGTSATVNVSAAAEARAAGAVPHHVAPGALRHILGNRPFLVYLLAHWMIGVLFNQSFSTLPLYMNHIGIGPDVYGRIMAVNGTMIVLGQLPLADRLSHRPSGQILVVGTVFLAAGFGLTGAFTTAAGLVLTVVLWTIGEMFLAVVTQAVVGDLAPPEYRARYFGAFTLVIGLAMAFGPPAGGWILAVHGPHALWGGAGAWALTAALMLWSIRGPLHRAASPPAPRPA